MTQTQTGGGAATADSFLGSWALVSFEIDNGDGTFRYPVGKTPRGIITYSPGARMSVHIMDSERATFTTNDLMGGTPEEMVGAYKSYIAYYGTYSVDTARGAVIHHLEGGLMPNMKGSDQVRFYHFDEDRLTLTTPPLTIEGRRVTGTVNWVRLAG